MRNYLILLGITLTSGLDSCDLPGASGDCAAAADGEDAAAEAQSTQLLQRVQRGKVTGGRGLREDPGVVPVDTASEDPDVVPVDTASEAIPATRNTVDIPDDILEEMKRMQGHAPGMTRTARLPPEMLDHLMKLQTSPDKSASPAQGIADSVYRRKFEVKRSGLGENATECRTVSNCASTRCEPDDYGCYQSVNWVRKTGIPTMPEKYPELSDRPFYMVTFEEVQLWLHDNEPERKCPRPCPPEERVTTTTTSTTTTPPPGTPACPPREPIPEPPEKPLAYNGISWPSYCFVGHQEEHVFLMGDWGAIEHGQYWGSGTKPAPNTGKPPNQKRAYAYGIDDKAQDLVAEQVIKRAAIYEPRYVMNAGDNFYWGGIGTPSCRERCGEKSMNLTMLSWFYEEAPNNRMFYNVFDNKYRGPGLDGKPWLSVLGNHDWGGIFFNAAWEQQIWYTWGPSGRWVMPGLYWHQHVKYPTKNFTVDWYLLESNNQDAKVNWEDPGHNICGSNNHHSNSCKSIGGPEDPNSCHIWFDNLWKEQLVWLEKKLKETTADWQIIVTHFPPDKWFLHKDYKRLSDKYGLDLIIGSHRHDTELWDKNSWNAKSGPGVPYAVVGGGGGVTSENDPRHDQNQYGFVDMTLTKEKLKLEMFNQWGALRKSIWVDRRENAQPDSCKKFGCGRYVPGASCQCTKECNYDQYKNCCADAFEKCADLFPAPANATTP